MSKPQSTSSTPSLRRGVQIGVGCFILSLALPFVFYYGYCWGLWGRHSLLLQYYFQCKCPAASEQARYPEEVDVLVSACHTGRVRLPPSGRMIYVHEKNTEPNSSYLLDMQSGEKISLNLPEGDIYFLTDDLIYIFVMYGGSNEGGEHIFDRTSGKQYPLPHFIHLQPNAYSYGKVNPDLLLGALSQVEDVFLIDAPFQPIIALSSDFRTRPEHSFIFEASALPDNYTGSPDQFLQQNNIVYQRIANSVPHEVISPDGKLLARDDGVYLVETNLKIVTAPVSLVRGWIYDGSGVVYSTYSLCLIHGFFPLADDTWCEVEVPQPVLLLKVPKEYLSATPIP